MSSENFTGWRKATYSHANSDCVEVGWRKASYSHGNSDCVEIAQARQVVCVRDTKQAGCGGVLEFSAAAWRSFIASAKRANA
jgi:hypothetical protein